MQQEQKLSLSTLKVSSFATSIQINTQQQNQIKGGGDGVIVTTALIDDVW